jgi:mannitol-1-phosphate 5-dehydrogenase
MNRIEKNKLVLFGAGRIGRSFIGQLFSSGGYRVVFIDVNHAIIDAINQRGRYRVIIKSDKEEVIEINNIKAVYADNTREVIMQVATAGILAVSVGLQGINSVFPLLAEGLMERQKIDNDYPLDIIIAENMRDADLYFNNRLSGLLPSDYPLNRLVGLIETSIGKMVPIMTKRDLLDDMLQVFAEPYNTLILNKKGFKNPIPEIKGLAPKDNMKAWVDRKCLFTTLDTRPLPILDIFIIQDIFIYMKPLQSL